MKSLFLSFLLIAITSVGFAQAKSESFKVSGECGSCKKKIESAAKKAGASYAAWNVDSKELTIKYNSTSTNTAKIQKAIAAAGYDTPDYKASDDAYNKLDGCCQYERDCDKEKPARDNKTCEDKKG